MNFSLFKWEAFAEAEEMSEKFRCRHSILTEVQALLRKRVK